MRYHDIIASTGVVMLVVGGFLVVLRPGRRLIGLVAVFAGLGLIAYGASFL
jgi:hypothetical protein